jgi:DNA polymerase III subunit gamma/tau
MSYQVIARKYRPRAFDAVVGQEAVARTLRNAISGGRIAHAYMFCGPRGVGKTSMARILAKALDCLSSPAPTTEPCGTCDLCERVARGEDLDVLEIDAASNRKVDDARTLIANVSFHPTRARFKVYIVDEVHMLTTEAFNALLKTLEEPPPHVKFIFATTDPQKVPPTILSRCQRFDFRAVPAADIARLLGEICRTEGLRAEDEALHAIARASLGGVRDAESLLEQLATLGEGAVRVADLHALLGTVPAERMRTLFDAVASGEASRVLA